MANGIQAASGTVQIDRGSTLDLSAGAASGSSADLLIQNGNLILGTKTSSVGVDYTNANFGAGNTFSPRAMVSGSGGILALGGTAQALIGDVSGGAGTTPVLDFGNRHVGASLTLAYQIRNTGGVGPSLRGALQTAVNGGNLTDPRLSGPGAMAANFGPISPGDNTSGLAVTFNATTAGAVVGQSVTILNNFDNVANQTLSITGAAYRLAAPSTHSPGPVHFGNFHVGQTPPSQALAVTNDVPDDGFSESLDASIGSATGGVTTNGGSFAALAPDATNSTALSVGINTGSAGSKNGEATIVLSSNGTGSSSLGLTDLTAQTVAVTGAVYRFAQPFLPDGDTLDFGIFRVGDVAQQKIAVTNTAEADGFSEALNGSFSGSSGAVTASNSFSALAPGATSDAPLLTLDTTTAGAKAGTATLALVSDGAGNSDLGLTDLPPFTLNATSVVFRLAQPSFPDGTTLDFGIVHVGDVVQQAVPVDNTAAADGFSEALDGSFSENSGAVTGSGSFSALAPGATSNAPLITLDTSTAGSKSGTATLALISNGTGSSGLENATLTPQVITASAEVNHYAQPVFSKDSGASELTGGGNAYLIDFGRRTIGESPPSVTLRLTNAAPAPADTLAGDYASDAPDFQLSGFGAFAGVDAGQHLTDLVIGLKTENLGTFSQTITLNSQSQNESGYSGALEPIVLTLTGEVAAIPTLKIESIGQSVLLSWPLIEQGWVLRQSNHLGSWSDVTQPVVEAASEYTVTIPRNPGQMFFRLEK